MDRVHDGDGRRDGGELAAAVALAAVRRREAGGDQATAQDGEDLMLVNDARR